MASYSKGVLPFISYVLGYLLMVALVLGHLSRFVDPDTIWFLPFFGMVFPISALMMTPLIIYWLIKKSKMIIATVIISLMCWSSLALTFQFNLDGKPSDDSFKVMTYNVRLFDYYNWSQVGKTRHWIYEFLKAERPDILCIQEFYHDNTGYFPTLDTLADMNSIRHTHIENYHNISGERMWGMATLTGYPIIDKGRMNFEGTYGNLCIYTDLLIGQDTVRVYNVHFQSIRFAHEDYKLIDEIIKDSELEDIKRSKMLLERMHDAWVKRSVQSRMVADHVKKSPYPVIVCGDFNDGPVSYAYQQFMPLLRDVFVERGTGLGNTYVGKVPLLRIDNILHDRRLHGYTHEVHPFELSDHFAVSARMGLKRENDEEAE